MTLEPRERVRTAGFADRALAWLGEHPPAARDAAIERLLGIEEPPAPRASEAAGDGRMPYMASAIAPSSRGARRADHAGRRVRRPRRRSGKGQRWPCTS